MEAAVEAFVVHRTASMVASMSFHELPWKLIHFHGTSVEDEASGFHGSQGRHFHTASVNSHGSSRKLMEARGISCFHGSLALMFQPWNMSDFHGLPWKLAGSPWKLAGRLP